MKNNKVFHPTKEYENGEGVLYLNLFNGSFIYNYPLVSIGLNSYSLNVTLVYNSSYNSNDFLSKRIGFGNGFKLNIHQYVFPYNISYNLDDFQVGDAIIVHGKKDAMRVKKELEAEYNI